MKRAKRSLKSTLCLILAVMFVFTCFTISANAYTTKATGDLDISPSNSAFKSAKNPKYDSTSVTISDSIAAERDINIYHYEAPRTGYYAIYTQGSLDTIGAVFEQQNFLWWTTSYTQIAYADDTSYSPYYRNCLMVVHMDWHEDYYICIRAYATKTGSYTLIIEPNEDKKSLWDGGIWDCNYVDSASANLGLWVDNKQYLTKKQALMNYLWLDGVTCYDYDTGTLIDFPLIKATYDANTAQGIALANTFMSLITCSAPSSFSITATLLGAVIQEVYSASTSTVEELKAEFENKCGITKTLVYLGEHSAYVEYGIQNGMLKETWFSSGSIPCYVTYYYANNDHLLTGYRYCYGSWQ